MAFNERQIILTKLEKSNPSKDWCIVDYPYNNGSQPAYYIQDADLRVPL